MTVLSGECSHCHAKRRIVMLSVNPSSSILIYFLAFLPSFRWTYGHDFWYSYYMHLSQYAHPMGSGRPQWAAGEYHICDKDLATFFCGMQLNLVAFKNLGKWLCWIDHCHALPSTAAGKLQDLPADVCLHVTDLEWPLQNLHATCRKEYQVMVSCRFLLFVSRKKKVDSFFPSLAFTYQLMYRHVAYGSMIKLVCRTWVFHFSSERKTSLWI